MVWTCTEEGWGVYQWMDDETGSARQEAQRKTKEEIYGCTEGGHEVSWCEIRGCRG